MTCHALMNKYKPANKLVTKILVGILRPPGEEHSQNKTNLFIVI